MLHSTSMYVAATSRHVDTAAMIMKTLPAKPLGSCPVAEKKAPAASPASSTAGSKCALHCSCAWATLDLKRAPPKAVL